MKQYEIPIVYQRVDTFTVEAESLQEAVEKALDLFLAIPDDSYISDSFDVDEIVEEEYKESFDINKYLQK